MSGPGAVRRGPAPAASRSLVSPVPGLHNAGVTETGAGDGMDRDASRSRVVRRPVLGALATIAAVWLAWWVAAEVTYRTGHVEGAYFVVFLGGPIAILTTAVVLVVAGVRAVIHLVRRRRTP